MQTAFPQTESAPALHKYGNRPDPRSLCTQPSASLCDTVYLVDGDRCLREEITAFLAALQFKVKGIPSGSECLNLVESNTPACVILNIQLPDLGGLELQRRLARKSNPPIIFIADQCDIASMVSAMKAGAMDLQTTPLDLPALAASVRVAFDRGRRQWLRKAALAKLQERFSLLTPREREVLPLVVGGLLNKQAASLLGISEVTFQIHRSQVVRKMQAGSVAELVRMAMALRIAPWRQPQE